MPAMTVEQYRRFLSEGSRTAKIATVRADGRPHVAPVWFVIDGDSVVFTTGKRSVKGRNLLRDSRVSICVDDETMPFAMVLIEGTAVLSEEPEALLDWATRLARRYVGQEQSEDLGRRNSGPGELLVRVPMEKVIAFDQMAG
jgi:PPOX class probable F420-dependent enzyme